MESPDISQFLSTISFYITAKDNNKPHLLSHVFSESATLSMAVNTDSITFPSKTSGASEISNVLVTHFNQRYENVYTFCLSDAIEREGSSLSCKWFVAMTEKESGLLRVGCGYYDWTFHTDIETNARAEIHGETNTRVDELTITIEHMAALAFQQTSYFFNELSQLPYPWCESSLVIQAVPSDPVLDEVRYFLVS
ncbi:hypothetical protein [Enterovibrio calviensis]|uniref:hypothetical protein n=1 Tax=Enterovibrio calviensis TaxID=91359 RepID=UPI00048665C9|nr:hypothetical protein [Enterovibrio calviensis]